MPFAITKTSAILDDLLDTKALVERLPQYQERLDALASIRGMSDDLSTLTNYGRMHNGAAGPIKWVASVPLPVMEMALLAEPDLLLNKAKFFAWMDRHPEWMAYTRKRARRSKTT